MVRTTLPSSVSPFLLLCLQTLRSFLFLKTKKQTFTYLVLYCGYPLLCISLLPMYLKIWSLFFVPISFSFTPFSHPLKMCPSFLLKVTNAKWIIKVPFLFSLSWLPCSTSHYSLKSSSSPLFLSVLWHYNITSPRFITVLFLCPQDTECQVSMFNTI